MIELHRIGKPGLDAMVRASRKPPKSPIHGRDLAETISSVYQMFAKTHPDDLIEHMRHGKLSRDEVYWALREAENETSLDVLIDGLTDNDMWTRWAALESLIQRKSKRAAKSILGRLRDRSRLIKFSVIYAMKSQQWLRMPDALPDLKRIQASRWIQREAVTKQYLAELIPLIEQERFKS